MKMWWGGLALRSFNKGREGKMFRWVTRYLGVVLPLLFAEAWSRGFPGGSAGKESVCNAGDVSSVLGWKDLLEEGMATICTIPVVTFFPLKRVT